MAMKATKALGYLPDDFHESVSHSLDYAYSDFCIATVAKQLGHTETVARYACFQSPTEHCTMPKQAS